MPHAVRGVLRAAVATGGCRARISPAAAPRSRAATSTPTRSMRSRHPSWAPAGCSPPRTSTQPSNATKTVDCAEPHTAETFAVGRAARRASTTPTTTTASSARSPTRPARRSSWRFLGADESLVHAHRGELGLVPAVGEGLGRRRPVVPLRRRRRRRAERVVRRRSPRPPRACCWASSTTSWLVCADGPTVAGAPKVPCSEEHTLAGGHHDQARRAGGRLPG